MYGKIVLEGYPTLYDFFTNIVYMYFTFFFPDGSYDIVNAGVLAALYNNVEDLMVR